MAKDDTVRQLNAQLRYYFKLEPSTLTDIEWARRVEELRWARTEEAKGNFRNENI